MKGRVRSLTCHSTPLAPHAGAPSPLCPSGGGVSVWAAAASVALELRRARTLGPCRPGHGLAAVLIHLGKQQHQPKTGMLLCSHCHSC